MEGGYISEQINLKLVLWEGSFKGLNIVWLRWATLEGELLPTQEEKTQRERAEKERERAEKEWERAEKEWERKQKEIAEALAIQERQQKEMAETLAIQERQQKEMAEALAIQERQQKEMAEALAIQERQQKEMPEYFWYDPFNPEDWEGFKLINGVYKPLELVEFVYLFPIQQIQRCCVYSQFQN